APGSQTLAVGVNAHLRHPPSARGARIRCVSVPQRSGGSGPGDTDLLRRYLDEIGRHRLLTAADEERLGARIDESRKAAARLETEGKAIKTAERVTLQRAVADGASARREFIQSNL